MKKYVCPSCHQLTRLVQKSIRMPNDIRRACYQCEHCGHLETIYFSDAKLRKLIKKQQALMNPVTKNSYQKKIEKRMNELRAKFEEVN